MPASPHPDNEGTQFEQGLPSPSVDGQNQTPAENNIQSNNNSLNRTQNVTKVDPALKSVKFKIDILPGDVPDSFKIQFVQQQGLKIL